MRSRLYAYVYRSVRAFECQHATGSRLRMTLHASSYADYSNALSNSHSNAHYSNAHSSAHY